MVFCAYVCVCDEDVGAYVLAVLNASVCVCVCVRECVCVCNFYRLDSPADRHFCSLF